LFVKHWDRVSIFDRQEFGGLGAEGLSQPINEIDSRGRLAPLQSAEVGTADSRPLRQFGLGQTEGLAQLPQFLAESADDLRS
jgi:hypothetical protein